MIQNQTQSWTNMYLDKSVMMYPNEKVVMMFKGHYPRLDLSKVGGGYDGKSVLDIGCGDGRDIAFLSTLGFGQIAGTEISQEIVDRAITNLNAMDIHADIRVGSNADLGFAQETFDYVLSWNVCYYMGEEHDFHTHVKEYARVMKPGAILVFSIPFKDCFVYKDGIEKDGYITITNDWCKVRNGSIQKVFDDEKDIENTFYPYFDDFVFAKVYDDWFGLDFHWFVGYCVRQ